MDNDQLDMSLDISRYIEEKYRDNYLRTGVSMYRYNIKGSGRDLLQTILTLVNDILPLHQLDKEIALVTLESVLNEEGIYELPYDKGTFIKNIELVKWLFNVYVLKFEERMDDDLLKLTKSLKLQLANFNQDLFDYIFVEPFSDTFNPKAYMEAEQISEADFPPQAKKEWLLSLNSHLFFWLVLTSDDSMNLVSKFFSFKRNIFKPCHPVIATDIYKMTLQLPLDFIKAFFYSFEQDAVRYSKIITSIEHKQEKEFIAAFHECDIESFCNHYHSFLKLALAFFKVYSLESTILPIISEYIDYDSKYLPLLVSLVNEVLHKSLETDIEIPNTRLLNMEELVEKYRELLPVSSPAEVVSPNDVVKPEEKNQKGKRQVTKDTTCYLPSDSIHKRFDVSKLVTLLTSKNEFADKSYVELGENNNQSLKDCLTYFLFPDDKNIKNKIENHEFNVKFKLRWKGRHAVSLRCLVRLLLNADIKKWANALDVFDSSGEEDDRLSREYVSVQDDKSPIWKPVTEVFGKKAIYNAGIDKEASDKTIKANEKEIREIINIVFECKK